LKIINREEFLKLPEGILFQKCSLLNLEDLEIKGETWSNDYWSVDINYAIDNMVINAETFILRKSKRFEILNNKLLKSENHPAVADDYMPYKVPWQNIPFEKIGPYK